MNLRTKMKVLCAFFIGAVIVCPQLLGESASEKTRLALPEFTYTQGWLGADDAYSISLGRNKSLWLFGDTFVADASTTLRSKATTMVRNSIGISTCDKTCSVEYFWRDANSDKPRSFFDSGRTDVWYWPLDAYRDGNNLYLSLMVVRSKPGMAPDEPFAFEIAGTRWVRIDNVQDSPEKWNIKEQRLTDSDLWVGISIVPDKKYVLFYSQVHEGDGKGYMTVLRVPRNKMDDPSHSLSYLGKDNAWHHGLPHGDAMHVIEQPISEMSVRYHPTIKKWVAVSGGPEFPSPRIVARTADSPIGPWSDVTTVFKYPEMAVDSPGYDKETFCYAAKEHTEFSDSKLVITYACNSFSLPKTISNMSIYKPQVLVVDLPK